MIAVGDRYRLGNIRRTSARFDSFDAVDTRLGRPVSILRLRAGATRKHVIETSGPDIPWVLDELRGAFGTQDDRADLLITDPELGRPASTFTPGDLPIGDVLDIARRLCKCLRGLHAARIPFRWLESELVLIGPSGGVQLVETFAPRQAEAEADIAAFGEMLLLLLPPDEPADWSEILLPAPNVNAGDEMRRLALAASERRAGGIRSWETIERRLDGIRLAMTADRRVPGTGRDVLRALENALPPDDLVALMRRVERFHMLRHRFPVRMPATMQDPGRGAMPRPCRRNRPRRALLAGAVLAAGMTVGIAALPPNAAPTATLAHVPSVAGISVVDAAARITASGLVLGGQRAQHSLTTAGSVLATEPTTGVTVAPGSSVVVVVSSGPVPLDLSALRGLDLSTARTRLADSGAVLGQLDFHPADAPFGRVISAVIGKENSGQHQSVDLLLTSGAQIVPVDIIGHDPRSAETRLLAAGFAVAATSIDTRDWPDGIVIGSSPAPGASAPAKSRVTLEISHLVGAVQ